MTVLQEVFVFIQGIAFALSGYANHAIIATVFICFATTIVFIRVVSHLHVKGLLISLRRAGRAPTTGDNPKSDSALAKPDAATYVLKTPDDAGRITNPMLKKATAEYIRTAKGRAGAAPVERIAKRAVSGIGLIGWRYTGLLPFIETMEIGLIGAGFILAVIFPGEAPLYGLLAILAFVLCRSAAAFFNIREALSEIAYETVLFLEREPGRFFVTETSCANNFFQASDRLQSAADLLASQMKGHSSATSEQLLALISAIREMKDELQLLRETQSAVAAQGAFIEANQKAIETSLHAYETSLQNLTQSVGDGLGAFINLHAQTAAQTINDAIRRNSPSS